MRRPHSARGYAGLIILAQLLWACGEDFDPASLINDIRVLGIAAEPADLAPGESTLLTPLVVSPTPAPGEEAPSISYSWEWCLVNGGPDEGFDCLTEELGLDPGTEALFDLGDAPTAVIAYPFDGETLRGVCEAALAEIEALPDFAELPSCDLGLEAIVRLVVRSGEVEKVAFRRIFLWFDAEPDPALRNANPEIASISAGSMVIAPDFRLGVAPGGSTRWFVAVANDQKETFRPRDPDEGEQKEEEMLFSWFTTVGEWDRDRSFSDEIDFSLVEAGRNLLDIPTEALEDPGAVDPETGSREADLYFVIRDGRGGISWESRSLFVVEPAGGMP